MALLSLSKAVKCGEEEIKNVFKMMLLLGGVFWSHAIHFEQQQHTPLNKNLWPNINCAKVNAKNSCYPA